MVEKKRGLKIYRRRKIFLALKLLSLIGLVFLLGAIFLFIFYIKDFPRPEKFTERHLFESSKIYDRTGQILLYEIYGEEKRIWTSLEEMPDHLKKAIIATEDANFYHHFGIDFRGITRAILASLKVMRPAGGGSTISQQLIRSTFLTLERTAERKTREIILALELERRYSKEQILEWYLNQVPFGRNTYGVEAASQAYFRKPVSEISLVEAATLVALIQAPSFYSVNLNELLIRRNYVLDRMVSEGYLNQEETEKTKREEINIVKFYQPIKAPHFTLLVKDQLEKKYGREFLEQRGLKILTTLDWELQQLAEKVVREGVERNRNFRAYNAGLVALEPKTGEVLALVGSANWFSQPYPENCLPGKNCLFEPKFNVVVGTETHPGRQPGSAFKPLVYAAAFQKGYDDKYVVIDEETNFGIWGGKPYIPQNYDRRFRGPVTLRESLAQSLNVPSVKVLADLAGLEDSIQTAKEMGITTLTRPASFYGLALVLGGGEVKLLDLVSAYSVFANQGLRVSPLKILRIEDFRGNIIEKNKRTPKRILKIETANLINDILSDNQARAPIFGLRSPLFFPDYQVAVKTGTTDDFRDGWAIGYPIGTPSGSNGAGTPSIAVGVWVGNNDNSHIKKEPGVVVAGPIFHRFLKEALLRFSPENFLQSEI